MNRAIVTLLIVPCVALLCGCNSVKLHKTTERTNTDSVASNRYDSGHLSSRVIKTVTKTDSTATGSTITNLQEGISLSFSDDTAAVTGPITIERIEGKLTVNTGGRKLKNITAAIVSHSEKKDSSGVTRSAYINDASADSDHVAKSSDVTLHKEEVKTAKDKESSRVPWVSIAVLGVIIIGFLYCWNKFFAPMKDREI